MSSEAHLKLALRRSVPLILICVLIGVAALLALTELQGPQYRASTRVLVSDPNLRSLLSGTSVPNVETQAQGALAAVLASSPGSSSTPRRVSTARTGEGFSAKSKSASSPPAA